MLQEVKNKVWDVGGWQKPGGYNTYQRWSQLLTVPLVASEWFGNTPATWGNLVYWESRKKVSLKKGNIFLLIDCCKNKGSPVIVE